MGEPQAGGKPNDPWPMIAGEVFTLPCEGCGEPVTLKRAIGTADDVAESWAEGQIVAWCRSCAPAAGFGVPIVEDEVAPFTEADFDRLLRYEPPDSGESSPPGP